MNIYKNNKVFNKYYLKCSIEHLTIVIREEKDNGKSIDDK